MSDQKPLVSLVVPIYNVERYVAECVKSCCKQTMRNIEIICVDDGSTDPSYEIVQKMYHQEECRLWQLHEHWI